MNIIVFDLEWNQSADGKEFEHPLLPFEIIEIGAQKLDEQLTVCGAFHALARPVIYTRLHFRTQEVIGITERELEKGGSFAQICRDFLDFCGEDCIFASWGPMDLTELQRNMRFFQVDACLSRPLYYYDVQKLYSLAFEDGKSRRSLEHAVDALGIPVDTAFHRADHDAWYTAEVLRRIPMELTRLHFSVDYYQPPRNKAEELHLHFPGYYKYVSRIFDSREAAMDDKTVTAIRCEICHRALRKKVHWFSGSSRIYYCLAECPDHGYVKGKIRLKKHDDGHVFAVKTVKMTDEEGAKKIRLALDEMRKRRKEKNRQGK